MLPCRKDQCLSWKLLNTAGFSNYKSSNYSTVVLKIEKLQRISITSISISLLYFRRHTWDQWFWGFLCRDDQWRWQTRPLRETLGWGCGWTGAYSASPGSDWKQGETNQLPLLTNRQTTRASCIWLQKDKLMSAHYSGMWSETVKACLIAEPDLGPKEAVAFLFHIVIDDAGHFLLPDFKAINADVVLDVLKWPVETIHGGRHLLQLGHQLTRLREWKIVLVWSFHLSLDSHRASGHGHSF